MPSDQYNIDAEAYLARASEAMDGYRDSRFIFYAAFELRCAIERLLFEYLVLISSPDGISRKKENLYSAKDFMAEIERTEPKFIKKLEFINIMLDVFPNSVLIVMPDLGRLKSYYGSTNNLLHAHKRPEDSVSSKQWWARSEHSMREAIAYVSILLKAQRGSMRLNDRGLEVFDKWERGELTDEEVRDGLKSR
jgi:hypothetical protein